jgi:hypothetical protein
VRAADPGLTVRAGWVCRRLGPHASRIELASLPHHRDEALLLQSMGWETANLHLGTKGARAAIMADLDRQARGWLFEAARRMVRATRADWKAWRRR